MDEAVINMALCGCGSLIIESQKKSEHMMWFVPEKKMA